MQAHIVYITFPDILIAEAVARALLEEKLIACANIFPAVRSLYRWEGEVVKAEEIVLICKTGAFSLDKLIDKVRKMHTYTCPCIVSWPITQGYAPFLEYLQQETASDV